MKSIFYFPVIKGEMEKTEYYIATVPVQELANISWELSDCVFNKSDTPNSDKWGAIPQPIVTVILSKEAEFHCNDIENSLGMLSFSKGCPVKVIDGASHLSHLQSTCNLRNAADTLIVMFVKPPGGPDVKSYSTQADSAAYEIEAITKRVITASPFLNEYTAFEDERIGKFSRFLFKQSSFYKATKIVLKGHDPDKEAEEFLRLFWSSVTENMSPWQRFIRHEFPKLRLREDTIAVQPAVILALGRLGNAIFQSQERNLKILSGLNEVNWNRANRRWRDRAVNSTGQMIKRQDIDVLIGNELKIRLGLELTDEEQIAENRLSRR